MSFPVVIAMAPNAWWGPWMNRQQLLSRLAARGWPVIYSNGPLSVWERHGERWAKSGWRSRFQEENGVWVDHPGKALAGWPNNPAWDAFVHRRHAGRLKSMAGQLGGDGIIAYIFHPDYARYAALLGADYVVYHAYDNFSAAGSWTEGLAQAQAMLVDSSDLLIATTRGVAAGFGEAGASKARELPNAADAAAFVRALDQPCPEDLARIPHPRIAYTGVISVKVDLPLIAEISEKRPNWHWVLVGPTKLTAFLESHLETEFRQAYETCKMRPNVHFLGAKKASEVPNYTAHMDINTMCYHDDGGWWEVAYPLKVHEYLAVGKPVVSSRLPRIAAELGSVIDFPSGTDGWIGAIERGLESGGKGTVADRQAAAAANTWNHRVDVLESWLVEMMDTKTRRS